MGRGKHSWVYKVDALKYSKAQERKRGSNI
jgi:hypothetical protein